jgi:hypothetical protein
VSRKTVAKMRPGSVLVDIAIDQGGCFETSRPTTHAHPTYVEEGVVHYCVTNMPGAVARTSTIALGNATLPFTLALADKGWKQALADDPHLRRGLNVHAGHITHAAVAHDLGLRSATPSRCSAWRPDQSESRSLCNPGGAGAAGPRRVEGRALVLSPPRQSGIPDRQRAHPLPRCIENRVRQHRRDRRRERRRRRLGHPCHSGSLQRDCHRSFPPRP